MCLEVITNNGGLSAAKAMCEYTGLWRCGGAKTGRGSLMPLCHPCPLGKFLFQPSLLPTWCSPLPPPSIHGASCSPARSCLCLGHFRVQQAWPLCRLLLVGCLEDWRASSCKEIPSGFCCQLFKNLWMSGLVQFKLMLSSVHYISMCLEQRRYLKVRIALSPASPRPWYFLEWENSVASCSQFCFLSKFLVVRYLLAWDLMLGVVLPFRMLMLYLRTMNV